MSAETSAEPLPGWAQFKVFCDIICAELDRDAILGLRRENVTGSPAVRLFVHAFEAAMAASRDEQVSSTIQPTLATAADHISFIRPFTSANIRGLDVGPTSNPHEILNSFACCLGCAITQTKSIPPGDAALEREFRRCCAAWESTTIDYDIVAPIRGIGFPFIDEVELVNGLRVASDSQLPEYVKSHIGDGPFRSPTVLLGRISVDKCGNSPSLTDFAVKSITQCVTAIRLATGRMVGCDNVHILTSESHHQTFNAVANHTYFLPECAVFGQMLSLGNSLTAPEVESTCEVAKLLTGSAGSLLEIAVERFNFATGRMTMEDQIIDLAIALESTICRGGGSEQLSYRFRVFGAAVLADKMVGDDAIALLGALYSARSKIVHAGHRLADLQQKVLAGRSDPARFVSDCREAARWVLLDFLTQASKGRSPEAYVKDLERVMIRSAKAVLG